MESMVGSHPLLAPAYAGKKVFLTGHTGFKGSWMLAWLQSLGATVKGYALPPEDADGIYNSLPENFKVNSVFGDIRDREKLSAELLGFQPDFIFHLAAQPLVRYSYQHPAETFDVNVTGTANLLEAAAGLPNKCSIVVITTDKVYHNNEVLRPYREDDRLGGYDPYSASKACAELVVDSFRHSFFNAASYPVHQKAIASARAGNVIGGGDWSKDRIVPDIIRSLAACENIRLRNPGAVRPWQHVLEPVKGYLLLGALLHHHPLTFAKAYNFGPLPEQYLTVKELVELGIAYWGNGAWQDISDPNQPHEAGLLTLDISLANKELHWKPKLTNKEAIEWTLEWFKQFLKTKQSIALEQIEQYEALAVR
ncbi:MAG: CDP-glucose 4,6-dehydratase [Chitinophagaceae bacterium]